MEFLAEFKSMMANYYEILLSAISTRNTQAIEIVERVHHRIVFILRTFDIQQIALDNENP